MESHLGREDGLTKRGPGKPKKKSYYVSLSDKPIVHWLIRHTPGHQPMRNLVCCEPSKCQTCKRFRIDHRDMMHRYLQGEFEDFKLPEMYPNWDVPN